MISYYHTFIKLETKYSIIEKNEPFSIITDSNVTHLNSKKYTYAL